MREEADRGVQGKVRGIRKSRAGQEDVTGT